MSFTVTILELTIPSKHTRICSILFLILNISLIKTVYNDCPKICSVCLPKIIICENGGYFEFPTKFQSETENITLVGQLFTSNILSPANMTGALFPIKLRYLAVRASSIHEILSRTFSGFNFLEILDLSENQILSIHDYAFEDLTINTLRLNDIGKLKLFPHSFSKLTVSNMSIKSSHLSFLDYFVFAGINLSKFEYLYLSNNNFRTIDQRFLPIIKQLKKIDFYGNPIVCNCSLLWLKKLSFFKIIYPKCVSPSNLRSRFLLEIDESEFKCDPPKITDIRVQFLSHQIAELYCNVDPKISKNSQTSVSWTSNYHDNQIQDTVKSPSSFAIIKINKSQSNVNTIYKCVAENSIGKSSIIVSLNWPYKWNSQKSNQSLPNDFPPDFDNISWTSSFYFRKRYTLVELIVAVISTFIATIFLFLIAYKICIKHSGCIGLSDKLFVNHHKIISRQKGLSPGYPSLCFNVNENGLHAAESNSQTYDCISINNALYPHQISNSLSGPFLDYKTHERVYPPKLVE